MSRRYSGLYYIYEVIADVRITNFLEFPTDVVALKSFVSFLNDKKDEAQFYSLFKACEVDENDRILPINKLVCNGVGAELMLKKEIQEFRESNEEVR